MQHNDGQWDCLTWQFSQWSNGPLLDATFGHGEGHVLRVEVRADRSYPDQSRATVSVWTPNGWTLIHEVLPRLVKPAKELQEEQAAESYAWHLMDLGWRVLYWNESRP